MSQLTENPFASTHSLENPFDDPVPSRQEANRMEELSRRERDLEAREAALNQKAEHIRKHGRNNFPPFFPLIYHAIDEEIPQEHRPLITRIFQLWFLILATLIINMVACIFVLTSGTTDGGKDLGASIMLVPVIGLLSFLLWYRPIYNGLMKEQALYYYIYFVFCGFHLLFSVYMFIGIPSTGSAGLIQTISLFSKGHIVGGVLGIIATVAWAVQGLGNLFYYRQIWNHHNQAGHTFTKAKGEFAQHGAKAYFSRS
ncbi:hypothetical protein BOTBODRAFT_35175 [Botryobasidium botryosum FD-172 SS1]|uniref:Scamp-domain-containing protein n=1 Tax=Botryobasidium botryosum (strain FD-172 SS1) TaxID=930990 RepID=A0A067M850_BOTB1|nr:hypothetical protein BOTBODRAFT_35175 [Botryobasidium botryosum FD-172 SS1]